MKKIVLFLGIISIVLVSNLSNAQMVDVTFQVDMQEQTVAAEGVHIAGSFPAPLPTWDPAGITLVPLVGTIYTTTLSLEVGTTVEFKYVNGNAWGQDEAVPPCCAQNNNRFLTVPPGGGTLDLICYGSCIPCNSSPTFRDITFQVDMSDETYTLGAFIAGNLQDPQWTPEPMIDMGDDIFQITLSLEEDECYQYKFVKDSLNWETVPDECKSFENNRFYEVPDFNQTLELVCYSSCVGCNPVDVTFSVDMTNETVTEGVFVAGSFNGWNTTATPLTDMGSNIWETTLTLQNGQDVEYKFINGIDGWEILPAACSWGGGNRHFVVPANPLILETVCFGACNPCSTTNTVDVTFVADMSSQLITGNVFLAGDFNDWAPGVTTMTHTGNSIYEATVTLGEGFIYGYKFIINDSVWEDVPAECNYNGVRTVIVPGANTTLLTDCFNECGACTTTLYRFNLSVFLEGPFNGTDMNTKLYDDGVLPLDQPFNTAPWNYDGQETITAAPDADIVDWLYIQFRETSGDASTALSDSLLDHQAAVLLSNGTVATPDGSANIFYTGNITKNLYVVIYHRNHLAVMSATPLVDILGIYAYDFTNNLSNAYNDGHKLLGGGIYGMIGGDSDANGIVDLNDKDVNWNNEAGSAGYYGSDLNMDSQVNNPDKNDIWEPNLTQETQIPE